MLATGLGLSTGRPLLHLARTAWRERGGHEAVPPGQVDDASRLSRTRVALVWDAPADMPSAEAGLRDVIARARAEQLGVSIAGARHSMGGQTIRPGGIVVNMLPLHGMELDEARDVLHVQAGALWSQIIPYLNQRGRSLEVMQSNNSFSVGGSVSVNCHGWQPNRPPIASTVEAFRLLLADGRVVRCRRDENRELFSLALGGYGLFGVILDVDLRVVPNEGYALERMLVPSRQYPAAFDERVTRRPGAGMAYGRLSVSPDSFLDEAILNVLRSVPSEAGRPSGVAFPEIAGLTRAVFRGQVGSDYGKRLRWSAEKSLLGLSSGTVYRNELLSEGVEVFENRSPGSTDVLHEYFVPADGFGSFVEQLRILVPKHHADLLNVTVRDVLRDEDTLLRYADRDMFAFVMLFNQERSTEGEARMQAMTREIVDAALGLGGRYYLPYRLHAAPEQFQRAYPQATRFFELKRRYDREGIFGNGFSLRYEARAASPPPRPAPGP